MNPSEPPSESRIASNDLPNSSSTTICDPFQFKPHDPDLPSTSGHTRITKKLGIEQEEEDCDLPSPLQSLDDLSRMLLERKLELEGDESYLTVDFCVKEVAIGTEIETVFSRNPRTQEVITRSNLDSTPPPPYSYNDNYQYHGQVGSTPVYREVYIAPAAPRDAGRAPPYQANEIDSFDTLVAFAQQRTRNKFIQKVYMILFIQLLITGGFVTSCIYFEPLNRFVGYNMLMLIIASGLLVVLEIVLFCYQAARKIFPLNFFLLFLLTVAMAYLVAVMACRVSKEAVLMAVGVTAGICLLVTFVAWQNWFDVTSWGMILCILSVVLIVYGLIAMIITLLTGSNIAYIIYACLATLLFSFYLLYDTQQILGGGRIALSPEEYILGAICLYVDIMTIFINLLSLFGQCRS